eukprot:1875373-Rhodomonas_salina.2
MWDFGIGFGSAHIKQWQPAWNTEHTDTFLFPVLGMQQGRESGTREPVALRAALLEPLVPLLVAREHDLEPHADRWRKPRACTHTNAHSSFQRRQFRQVKPRLQYSTVKVYYRSGSTLERMWDADTGLGTFQPAGRHFGIEHGVERIRKVVGHHDRPSSINADISPRPSSA